MQVVRKEKRKGEIYHSNKQTADIKYKLAYFYCFPNSTRVFCQADEKFTKI